MRVRLTAPVILNGHREPGYVFPEGEPNDWTDERCMALLERGVAEEVRPEKAAALPVEAASPVREDSAPESTPSYEAEFAALLAEEAKASEAMVEPPAADVEPAPEPPAPAPKPSRRRR